MTLDSQRNRSAWAAASQKHVLEYQEHLDQARNECSLSAHELDLLRPILAHSPEVVRRADELGASCRYVVAQLPGAPLSDACADLVSTGKGALTWLPDLRAWAADVARLPRPGVHLFIYEAHPAVPV